MDNFLKKAEESFDNDNYEKAIEYCNKLIDNGLNLIAAYRIKAFSLYFISNDKNDKAIREALKSINIAIEQDFDNDNLYYIKSIILEESEGFLHIRNSVYKKLPTIFANMFSEERIILLQMQK